MQREVEIDEKYRIVIPSDIREELKLGPEQKTRYRNQRS
ncbi:MAG: division/cell wall cluster transcriptional repressor MraZ [Nitrososphaerales archaeon]